MSIQVWSIGLPKQMIEDHVHIRSTEHVKQVAVHEKKKISV